TLTPPSVSSTLMCEIQPAHYAYFFYCHASHRDLHSFPYTTLFRSCGMKLSDVAIGRPVLASMMSAALVLFGVIGYTRLTPNSTRDRKSTRLNSSHVAISYAVFCLKKKKQMSRHASTRAASIR